MKEDTIGGFNSMLEKQKKEVGKAYVSTIMFNTLSKVVHDRVTNEEVSNLTNEDYEPNECIALLDALGSAMKHISMIHKYVRKEDVPDKTLFVIMTDGLENASTKYSHMMIRKMIEDRKKMGWDFYF